MDDIPTEKVAIRYVTVDDFLVYGGEALSVVSVTISNSTESGRTVQVMMIDANGVEWVTNAYEFRDRTIVRRDHAVLMRGYMWLAES